MHILKTLKSNGKAAVILPHGVLFRGNAEATIRETIIKKHWIKGIISLPANFVLWHWNSCMCTRD